MSPLIKKEIRLLLPAWITAMLLALIQVITRPYDFYVASLLFFGLTIMALTTIGRETSLNTFSSLLAQPAERLRIWQVKLSVLAVAFLTVFIVWLAAFGIALIASSRVNADDAASSYNLFITVCLIATATFTGGLWTTLLLRQIAGAFWLTLLVPAVLSGFSGAFFAQAESDDFFIAVVCVIIAIYSVGGFLFARWLFFRAQDVGWSGGMLSLPGWKIFAARSANKISTRNRRPMAALLKKEFQLQQVSLVGAAGLLVLHAGIIGLRKYHPYAKDSAGEILTSIFWMLWLVMAPVIGSLAVAEERRLGVMEGQLCLPVSRRIQFAVKGIFTLLLGTLLGGVMPMLLENTSVGLGAPNPIFSPESRVFPWSIVAFTSWLALVSFFGSTLARSFLQAVGFAIATFIGCTLLIPIFTSGRMFFLDFIPAHSILPLIIAVPALGVTLVWLAYFNFKNLHHGWSLWRRNLLGFAAAVVFIAILSAALYNRVWEVFEPGEPAHGAAKFSLAHPPVLQFDNNLLAQLPDGRVWFDYLNNGSQDLSHVKGWWHLLINPLPKSAGAPRFVAGSNWQSATAQHVDFLLDYREDDPRTNNQVTGYLDTVGIKTDGTLWISSVSKNGAWTGDRMDRFSDGTNWQQLVRARYNVLLLKNDGTLWCWGTNHFDWSQWQTNWPNLRTRPFYQIGTNSDWKELYGFWDVLARKADGKIFKIFENDKSGREELQRETNLDQASLQTLSFSGGGETAYVRPDGTLWMSWRYQSSTNTISIYSGFVQIGAETNWVAVALSWQKIVALKSDGSLWQWHFTHVWDDNSPKQLILTSRQPPVRLGIHNDWVAIASTWLDVIAVAADGSLRVWPNREQYEQSTLLKLPRQPQPLGNILSATR